MRLIIIILIFLLILSSGCYHRGQNPLLNAYEKNNLPEEDNGFENNTANISLSDKEIIQLNYTGEHAPELNALLKEFDYDEAVAAGNSEFEQMCILKDWVHSTLNFGNSYNPRSHNALEILRLNNGLRQFYCSNYAAVFIQSALSLGWIGRYVHLRGHVANEIWSSEYKKWVFMDPTYNIHFEKEGMPLGASEIKEEIGKNNGTGLILIFGADKTEKRYPLSEDPFIRFDRLNKTLLIKLDYLSKFNKTLTDDQLDKGYIGYWPEPVKEEYLIGYSYLERDIREN